SSDMPMAFPMLGGYPGAIGAGRGPEMLEGGAGFNHRMMQLAMMQRLAPPMAQTQMARPMPMPMPAQMPAMQNPNPAAQWYQNRLGMGIGGSGGRYLQ